MGAVKSLLMMLRPLTLTLLILHDLILCPAKSPASGGALSEFIRHYEPLNYDTQVVHKHHHRAKRSLRQQLKIDFTAHNREFRLRLERDASVYHPDLIVENSHHRLHHDMSNAYSGHLQGEPGSSVHGVILRDGRFEGKVTSGDDVFVIERTERHFSDPQHFHSVIYRHSDVKMDNLNATLCKGQAVYHKLQNGSAGSTPEPPKSHRSLHRRHTRSTIDPAKQMCTLYLQADHLFYQKFHSNEETVIEQLTQHVQGVNEIYKTIDFDEDGYADNINFIIKRIKVHTDPNSAGYKFPGNYGVETFLELFSEDNFDAFCLAYMFTYRDFEGGTLGLAWTGDLQNAGGVCEKNGQFRGSLKSLNSGIVTILNYGKDVPSTVSHVTMAHEFGHNMGSQHDPETNQCSPGGERGNYIMFARATSGDKPNNNRFSHCSKGSMAKVMAAKARHKEGCFIPPTSSICGNGVVEAGEECDCGWEDECLEQCCYPQTSSDFASMHSSPHSNPCTRRERAVCSPSEGPCCSASCQLIPLFHNKTCRQATSCKDAAICDGSSAECPASHQRPDKTLCDKEFVCYHGECTGSICLAYELESCQCTPARPDDYKDPSLCILCCKLPGEGSPCLSAFEWNIPPFDVPDLMAKPGTPCNDYKGYCDVFQRCREVDPSGPLANLKKLIFSEEGVETLKEWLNTYWYVVLVVALSFVIFLAILVRLCTPKKTIIKVITTAGLDGTTHSVQQVMTYPVTASSSSSSSPLKSAGSQWVARRLMPPTATGTIPSTKPLPSCSKLPFKMPLGYSSGLQRSSHPDLIAKVPQSRTNLPAMFRHRDGWV